jgi:hypothetical protein
MKVRELIVHPMLDITWLVQPFLLLLPRLDQDHELRLRKKSTGSAATRAEIHDRAFIIAVRV